MKWIPIDKAKIKFGSDYLVASKSNSPIVGTLLKSETTNSGISHTFITSEGGREIIGATHIAIITDPNKKEE